MNTFLCFTTLIAASQASVAPIAAASYIVRAPEHDSASIEHHRLGGNFAYSTAEAHAYASVNPQISTITHPVAETTHTHVPAPIETYQPDPIVRTHHVAQPIFQDVATYAQVPVTGPVATHQTVQQPIVHETRTHTVQQVAHAVPAAGYAVAAAPAAAVATTGYAAVAAPAAIGYANAAVAAPAAIGYANAALPAATILGH